MRGTKCSVVRMSRSTSRDSPHADFINLLRLGGETEVTEEGVVEWLDMDVEEQGFRHETDDEIIASVHGQNVTGDDDDDDDDDDESSPSPKLSELRYHLDKAMEAIERLPGLDTYYPTLREIRGAVIKRQHNSFRQKTISKFFKPAPQKRKVTDTSEDEPIASTSGISSDDE